MSNVMMTGETGETEKAGDTICIPGPCGNVSVMETMRLELTTS